MAEGEEAPSVPGSSRERSARIRKVDSSISDEDAADAAVLRLGQSKSVLVEPSYMYPSKAETDRSQRRHHQSVTQQMRLEQNRVRQRKPLPDWRVILQQLTAWTPERSDDWQADAVKIILPKETASEMLSGVDNNIWAIRRRTGCAMKLFQNDGEDGSSSVVLSGSEVSLNKAAEEILRVAKKATIIRLPQTPEKADQDMDEKDGPTSHVASKSKAVINAPWRENGHLTRPYTLKGSVNDIAKPSEWTKESFEMYVSALVNARVPNHLLSKAYPYGGSHDKTVISLLHTVFNDDATRSALSTSAFKLALAFMCRKGHPYRPDARALFVRMEQFGLRMDTEVFNILLQSTVKVKDLRNFDTTMRLMVGRGHAPDLATWVLFLRIIHSEDVKRYILHAMATKGLLRTQSALRRVAKELAPHDADRAVAQGKGLQAFMADQEARYGAGWLTRDAGNRIMDVLGRFGRFDDCLALLDIMATAGPAARPDIVTLNTILTHAKVRGSMRVAADALRKVEQLQTLTARSRVLPDAITYHLLFEMAWKRRLPHAIGVVWRYAALARLTSYRMRRRASQLLAGELSPSTMKKLGPLAGEDAAIGGALVDSKTLEALVASSDDRDKALQNMGAAVSEWYQEQYRHWEPDVNLGTMLGVAMERDFEALEGGRDGKNKAEGSELVQQKPLTLQLRPRVERDALPAPSRQQNVGGEGHTLKIQRTPTGSRRPLI
ncbi:putative pentatricopeptide repeat domain-containing protein [Phaeoacremonium minimum UCRPA7]|uniref:Putative pentatricopeptide repeat domain-containing protein n=1 Tax=Phaeoacremonium minimum (strain UCR-PA7) TaxID=1286976 RepID=R8BTU6_PHAM7|nr:putative pentatricopeptide repeat domain-containing protein [Phaeoacremonium minimum UCRPA7]EOO02719.1 putative pentatricopeptide repeat domain-containing protein [Phaeoacremonium minimum UCRPA7]